MSLNLGADEQVLFEGHPSWRSILGFYLKWTAVTILAAVAVGFITDLAGDDVKEGLVILILIAGIALTIVIGFVMRVATRYTITNRRLHIKRGIVSREVQESRLSRVQDVTYTQSLLQRLLQVGDVDFDTAAEADDLVFAGVADPDEVVGHVHRATESTGSQGLGEG